MRKTILLFCLGLVSFFLKAQSYSYVAFPDSNADWYCHGYEYYYAYGGGIREYDVHYSFTGDTLIGGVIWHKMPEASRIMRTDSLKRTYYRRTDTGDPSDHLVYDFSLAAGDSINDTIDGRLYQTRIDSISYILIDTGFRKKFYIRSAFEGIQDTDQWIEGIGSLRSPGGVMFYPRDYNSSLCEYDYELLQKYQNSDCRNVPAYVGVGIGTGLSQKTTLAIYPNPASEYICIENHDVGKMLKISLLNSLGQKLDEEEVSTIATIDLRSYSSGIYVLVIRDDNNEIVTKKITKN